MYTKPLLIITVIREQAGCEDNSQEKCSEHLILKLIYGLMSCISLVGNSTGIFLIFPSAWFWEAYMNSLKEPMNVSFTIFKSPSSSMYPKSRKINEPSLYFASPLEIWSISKSFAYYNEFTIKVIHVPFPFTNSQSTRRRWLQKIRFCWAYPCLKCIEKYGK